MGLQLLNLDIKILVAGASIANIATAFNARSCRYSEITRFIQKVPGLGGYLKELTSFHPDISQAHFSSQF